MHKLIPNHCHDKQGYASSRKNMQQLNPASRKLQQLHLREQTALFSGNLPFAHVFFCIQNASTKNIRAPREEYFKTPDAPYVWEVSRKNALAGRGRVPQNLIVPADLKIKIVYIRSIVVLLAFIFNRCHPQSTRSRQHPTYDCCRHLGHSRFKVFIL